MAVEHNFTESDEIFAGEAKEIRFTVYDTDGVTPVDVTGWALAWIWQTSASASADALLKLTTGSPAGITIEGVYNADPAVNTQAVVCAVADTDTDDLAARTYHHALWRTDDGSETVLSYGTLPLRKTSRYVPPAA